MAYWPQNETLFCRALIGAYYRAQTDAVPADKERSS